jgi:hypothetical protein
MGEMRNERRILVGKSLGKRPIRRPRRICEDNIKMDLREMGLVQLQTLILKKLNIRVI